MRFYETSDVDFFVNLPNKWDLYCQYPPNKRWDHKNLKPYTALNYYRDIEGSRIEKILDKHLYLGEKPPRINPWACLPLYYALGARFIKVEQALPAGFTCAPLPMSLKELQAQQAEFKKEADRKRKGREMRQRLLAECRRAKLNKLAKKFALDLYADKWKSWRKNITESVMIICSRHNLKKGTV